MRYMGFVSFYLTPAKGTAVFFQHGGKEAAEEQERYEIEMDLNNPFPIPPVTPFLSGNTFFR